jgi:hypothetical protein
MVLQPPLDMLPLTYENNALPSGSPGPRVVLAHEVRSFIENEYGTVGLGPLKLKR